MFTTTFNKDEKLWYGQKVPPLYNDQVSMAQAMLNAMATFGSKVAQINDNDGTQVTFNEMRIKCIRVAQNLQARGFRPKQILTLISKNYHNVAPVIFASLSIACPLNPIDPSFGRIEFMHMLSETKPAAIFCEVTSYDIVNEALLQIKHDAHIFTFNGSAGRSEPIENLFQETHIEHRFLPVKVDGPNDAALIICSSGTTGLPKGVCVSHSLFLDAVHNFKMGSCDDVMLCFSSLYWISGLTILFRGTLCGATRLITSEVYSPELALRLIEQYKVTIILSSPHQIILMMKNENVNKTDLSSIRSVLIGGTKMPLYAKQEMQRKLPNGNVIVGYGLSESGGAISLDYPPTKHKDNVGRMFDGFIAKIVDDNGNRCGINVDGEIRLKMNFKFLGYYGNEQATREVFDDEDFLKTGDVGHFDEDGDLCITGRIKELIKYCSFQICPSLVEDHLSQFTDIKASCVIGIPDFETAELPAAVIVRNSRSNVTEKHVFNMVADHFADCYKLRGGVYFLDSLPTTPSGKIIRRLVREKAIAMYNERNA